VDVITILTKLRKNLGRIGEEKCERDGHIVSEESTNKEKI